MAKKILIISSFFEETIGYQEVQFAETLYSMGYTVKIIATDRSNLDLKKRLKDSNENYEVKRIKKLTRLKNTFYPKENIKDFFDAFNPDIAFLVLPGSGIPYFLMKYIVPNTKVVSVFSDTTIENRVHMIKGTKGSKLIFNLLKLKWYNEVFERSDLILANTNETASILENAAKKSIENKLRMYGLGYDRNKYFYSEEIRKEFRKELELQDTQKLIVTVSRVYKGKPFAHWVEQITDFLRQNRNYTYLIAGFSDTKYSEFVKDKLAELDLGKQLLLYPFTSPEKNNKIFNAADYSLWFAPTISIQQSMGTGLFPVLPSDSTLNHLVENKKTGLYYFNFCELKKILSETENHSYDRKKNAEVNQKYSYQNILQKVISEIS